jgi:hypothetical protein
MSDEMRNELHFVYWTPLWEGAVFKPLFILYIFHLKPLKDLPVLYYRMSIGM